MPTGLAIPVGVTPEGRAKLSSGETQLVKIIGLYLSQSDSENPFQTIGDEAPIFAINDSRTQGVIRYRLERLFSRLAEERRAKLVEDTVNFYADEAGELTLEFRYHNLRTNRPEDYRGTVDQISGRVVSS